MPVVLRPDLRDLRVIGFFTGRIVSGLGLIMLLPVLLGLLRREIDDAMGLVIGAAFALILGLSANQWLHTDRDLTWSQAMATVALSWLVAAFIGAVPLFLSGHYSSYLDAYFDAMSGFATAGLAVINDLDHVSDCINLWRHLMQFMGGQGLVLVALSLFAGGGGLTGLYIGEGREDKILPNVRHTAHFIWRVSLLYGLFGTVALWGAVLHAGMPPVEGLLHAVMLFMAAFDTGGFAPTAASLGFYHSGVVEAVASVIMVAGALSFALHYRIMQGRRPLHHLVSNFEVRILAVTATTLFAVAAIGLAQSGVYDSAEALFRRGFVNIISAHTGTGFGTIPGRLFVTQWGVLAPALVVLAMAIGGMAGSTSGGIKALRLGLVLKAVVGDIRRIMVPANSVVIDSYNDGSKTRVITTPAIRTASMIVLLYVLLYLVGALAGMFYGYTIQESLFESTSAAAAVGLSVGLVGPNLETGLKVVYIAQMWIGRLEFISVFALFGYGYALLRGKP